MDLVRLGRRHTPALRSLLDQDPVVNLFLQGFLDVHPVEHALWAGAVAHGRVYGAVLLLPARLMVPWCPDTTGSDQARTRGRR